jgi:hypothetical protein
MNLASMSEAVRVVSRALVVSCSTEVPAGVRNAQNLTRQLIIETISKALPARTTNNKDAASNGALTPFEPTLI